MANNYTDSIVYQKAFELQQRIFDISQIQKNGVIQLAVNRENIKNEHPHTAHRPPPTANCPPPTAYRLPPTAYRLPQTAYLKEGNKYV